MEKNSLIKAKEKKGFSELLIENKDYIYPALFYIAGLLLGAFLYAYVKEAPIAAIMKSAFEIKEERFSELFINRLSFYLLIYAAMVLLGMCLIGFPFINIIPLAFGFEIALKAAYYYVNYSLKGIAFSLLMIAPESAAFLTVLIYTIKTSASLSKGIYSITLKKTDMIEELELKSYLKIFLIYGIIVVFIAFINASATYFLNSIIKL